MQTYTVQSNGQTYKFSVYKDLTQPCPECGVPACGKENYFWINQHGQRETLVLDGAILELIIEEYFNVNIKKVSYVLLPKFLRECNENIGWSEADDFEGTKVDREDLLKAIKLIKIEELQKWMQTDANDYLTALKSLTEKAILQNRELYIARS